MMASIVDGDAVLLNFGMFSVVTSRVIANA